MRIGGIFERSLRRGVMTAALLMALVAGPVATPGGTAQAQSFPDQDFFAPDSFPAEEMPQEEAPQDDGQQPSTSQEKPNFQDGPAPRMKNPVAVFSGLDKITGRITEFDVTIDETVQFGALQVTPRVCYASARGDATRTDSFVEVDEITLDRQIRRIFSGWMFADSPGLNAVEHPVYDVWLKSCKTDSAVPAPAG